MGFVSGSTYRFTNVMYPSKALNVYGDNAASTGRNVCLFTDKTSDPMQKWVVKSYSGGYRLHSYVSSSYVLDCSDGSLTTSYANNAHLCATSQTTANDCVVTFVKVAKNVYRIKLLNKNLYLTAANANVSTSGLPASSISTSSQLTGGNSNVYWRTPFSSGSSSFDKQCWNVTPKVDGSDSGGLTKNYLTYPTKTMNITQGYNGSYNHYLYSGGTPADYPIDEACEDSGRSYIYCPCDKMVVKNIYGVGGSGTNTIWLQSTEKVVMPSGTDYVVMLVIHPEDDDLSKISVGDTFTRGEAMFREGKDGYATGNHFHISVGKGTYTGWTQNSNAQWVLTSTNGTIKPQQAFYLDSSFTNVINSAGISFTELP